MLDELVGPSNAHDGRANLLVREMFEDGAAIATHQDMIFKRDNHIGAAAKEFVRARIDGLCKTWINDRAIETFLAKLLGGFAREALHIPKRKERNLASTTVRKVLQDLGFANLQNLRLVFDRDT